jgi:nucleoside-diphosphate-sugar epimerase
MNKHSKLVVVAGGTGKLGRLLVDALLTYPEVRLRILARDPSRPEVASLAQERVDVVPFDVVAASEAERLAAVRDAWAVVSTLQGGPEVIIDAQLALLKAAKAAGARRFIPSDYSYDVFALPPGININSDWRRTLGEQARREVSDSFEVVHILQGIFTDRVVLAFLGAFDAEQGVLRYWGDGRTPIDWTTWEDTARFTAAAALDERKLPEHLGVVGERMDILTFGETWEAVHKRPLKRKQLGTLEELRRETLRRQAAEPANMFAWLPLMYAQGMYGGQALIRTLHNSLFPQVRAETVAQAIARGAV